MSLAIFWGLVICLMVKSLLGGSKGAATRYRMEDERKDFDLFCEKYSSDITWREFDNKLYYSQEAQSLREELKEIIGRYPSRAMLYHAFLALDGKVPPQHDLVYEYEKVDIFHDMHEIYWQIHIEHRGKYEGETEPAMGAELKDAKRKFLVWYDKKLEENGMPHRIKVCNLPSGKPKDSATHRCELDYRKRQNVSEDMSMRFAVFFWEPARKLINMSDLRSTDVINM